LLHGFGSYICWFIFSDMDPNDGKMGRLPFGDITNISVLGAQNLHGNELKRQRERLCASGLSQEQRDEGNKRRREAYAKKKKSKTNGGYK